MNNLEIKDIDSQLNFPVRALINQQFNQTYALVMVDFGSVDTLADFPAGIAHFLEHKLFAKPTYNSDQRFAQFGAETNAFTSYTKTAFQFKCVGHVAENVATLLDLISQTYFTKENVAREQAIINQEIQMYADMPDWMIEQTTLNNLFPQDPIAQDIAGSIQSIKKITPQLLQQTYQQYYVPSNLRLYLAGQVNVSEVKAAINQALDKNIALQQLTQRQETVPLRLAPRKAVVHSQAVLSFKAQRPHFMVGIRVTPKAANLSAMILLQNQLDLLLELILGDMSKFHQNLTKEGLIDDSFGYNVVVERQYAFILISGESQHPQALLAQIESYLIQQQYCSELTVDNLELIRRDSIGAYLFAQDYLENLTTEACELDFYGVTINQVPRLLGQIQVSDLQSLALEVLQPANLTKTILYPE